MKIYELTECSVTESCQNYKHLRLNPSNPGTDPEPERIGIYTSEVEARKALSKCTASLEWEQGFAMPFVRATWHELISYTSGEAEDAEECICMGDPEMIDCTTCPNEIQMDAYSRIVWDGRRWIMDDSEE